MIGRQIGPYTILSPLGSGGMGEVYRARDGRLGRDVALKILPAQYLTDPGRRARLEREARLLASLNHPHIGAIYGVEDAGGTPALVLELIEGETLADRLKASRVLVAADALRIANQIADALESAHEQGIVHRDLKPANVKLTPAGVAKVLDFGIAKALTSDAETPGSAQALTRTADGTAEGVILGTAPYMSPEQVRGQPVDKRTDIWAFGCVLFEMLSGRPAFSGATLSDMLAAILEREPDWAALPPATPPAITRLIRRCVEKDARQRLRDIGDAGAEIRDALAAPQAVTLQRGFASRKLPRAAIVVAVLLALTAGAQYWIQRSSTPVTALRLSLFTPGQLTPQLSAAISPDGLRVAFVSTDQSGTSILWVRALDDLEARVVPGTEDAAHPFWSPDNRSIGFIAQGKLKRVDLAGGAVQTLTDAPLRAGGSWGPDGTILFSPRLGAVAAIPSTGGSVTDVPLRVPPGPSRPAWPFFLPDGRHFLFFSGGGGDSPSGIYVGSRDTPETRFLIASEHKGAYAPPGYLLFVRGSTLMAQAFNADRLELTGTPAIVADGVWAAPASSQASFSVSTNGTVAYVNAALQQNQLAWFDRRGQPLGSAGVPERYTRQTPEISPDDTRIAVGLRGQGIWLVDAIRRIPTRLTFNQAPDFMAIWAADGSQVLVLAGRDGGGSTFYLKNANGQGGGRVVFELESSVMLHDWSLDGRDVVYGRFHNGQSDLWVLPVALGRQPFAFLETRFNETQAQLSPDGRWIAFTSNESGGDEVYLESFPKPASKRQVSVNGGVQPRWRRDGRELFYLGRDQNLMAVPVTVGASVEVGPAVPLFRTRLIAQGSQSIGLNTQYDVTSDGQRFLLSVPPDDPVAPITVVSGWPAALK